MKKRNRPKKVVLTIWKGIYAVQQGMDWCARALVRTMSALLLFGVIVSFIIIPIIKPIYKGAMEETYNRLENLSEDSFSMLRNTRIYDTEGSLLGEIHAENYTYVDITDISTYITQGYILVEDNNFKYHNGIDYKALLRAGLSFVKNKFHITQGGSTITQQVVKNNLLTQQRTIERKIVEFFLARELEKKCTKTDIMEYYCNTNYYGNRCYGVESACKFYFGCSASDVTISQAAVIIGISNSPNSYNPVDNMSLAIEKRNFVLSKMVEGGLITEDEYQKAKEEPIEVYGIREENQKEDYMMSYAISCTAIELMKQDGFTFQYVFDSKEEEDIYRSKYSELYSQKSQEIRNGGYDIYTSFDTEKQKVLQNAVDSVLKNEKEKQENGKYALQAAAVSLDTNTGYVVAIVGGRGTKDEYNRAFLSSRQPGSTIKPLLDYTPAFDTGKYYPSYIMTDKAINGGPKNASGSYLGSVSMRDSIARSINTIAWQTLRNIGIDTGLSYLEKMKFSTLTFEDTQTLSISLGGFTKGVHVTELAKGYQTLASGGTYTERTCITKIKFQNETIYREQERISQVYSEDASYLISDCMRGVLEKSYGTGYHCKLDNQVAAAKSGTTNDSRDGWFAGYTAYYTTAVWVGRDDNGSVDGMYGATYAGRIWQSYMNTIHKSCKKKSFKQPNTIINRWIDGNGNPVDYKTNNQDIFSRAQEAKAEELEKQKRIAKQNENAEKAVQEFEAFYIHTVEDCYLVEEKYDTVLEQISSMEDTDTRSFLIQRIATKNLEIEQTLEEWSAAMLAYEALSLIHI